MKGQTPLVTFVIGGTQKGGTNALHHFLRQHPQICMPHNGSEVHYFDIEENFSSIPDYDQYHCSFQPLEAHRAVGDVTPIYMYWDSAPSRIWRYNPAMKWIVILRDPVDRAFSQWNMERRKQLEDLPFQQAIEEEVNRSRRALPLQHRVFSYLDRGYYSHQIRRLFRMFGRENCLVLLNEDLSTDHVATLRRTFDFLGVNDAAIPPSERVHEGGYREELAPDLRSRLLESFRADICETERLIGRDLSAWREARSSR